jgi:hypothetical protein
MAGVVSRAGILAVEMPLTEGRWNGVTVFLAQYHDTRNGQTRTQEYVIRKVVSKSNMWGYTTANHALAEAYEAAMQDLVLTLDFFVMSKTAGPSVPPPAEQSPVGPLPLVAPPPSAAPQTERQPEGSQRVFSQERTTKGAVVQLQHQYDAFRLFVQPNTDAERLSSVSAGVPLKVIEDRDQWVYIETPDGKRGWILREWIQE